MDKHDQQSGEGCEHLALDASAASELAIFVEADGMIVISGTRQRLLDFAESIKRFAEHAAPGVHVHADPGHASDDESAPLLIEHMPPPEPDFHN